ncbi:hypothetical protein Pst134EA_022886 [Puccinia striiformis f. sp. tritici]|uniref:hypothetical protein n=1 Tax=Puccinia striiformis f. sp. tritici TaxID=168172 RepID=UPI0020089783|nr:hypothetical protein Pst134EA_022886 [Puccinia striiformis f. sp. tritici]KAH9445925.1 hypothetical protein Pst134EB_023750 [Puccinia striiformis f. sp. tritici]KAH9455421.1 hypothetical protein Pst134EA_022886 [Puccinia striiformis f. sp. tritici]
MYTTTSYIRIKCHTRNCLMCLQDKLEEIKMAFDADGTIGDVFGMVFDCHHSSDLVEGAGLVQSVDNGPSLQGGDVSNDIRLKKLVKSKHHHRYLPPLSLSQSYRLRSQV